jgi:uncharacterized paraquat-inducible protein A
MKKQPLKNLIKCQHCSYLFNKNELAKEINKTICPSCGEKLNRIKMLEGSKSNGFPCQNTECGMKHTRKDADQNGDIYCKKCGQFIAHIGKGITVLSLGI